VICELNFMSKVLNLHINRKRLAVVLEDRIHIYDVTTMKLLHTIDTLPNTAGISSMSSDSEKSILAYPSNSNTGELTIFDCINLRPLSIIKAHKAAVTKMTFNQKGDLLATASDKVNMVNLNYFNNLKGTIIRVFKIPTTEKLYQFRRGSLPANIHHLAFDSESNLLSVTSDSDTIHIFKLTAQSSR
jgi:autophagy-related protein 18